MASPAKPGNPGPQLVASMRDLHTRMESGTVGDLKQSTYVAPAPAKEPARRVYDGRTLLSLAHHRNGVGGQPYYVALWEYRGDKFLVVYFDKEPKKCACAVLNVELIAAGNIDFGENSWRGDYWQDAMTWAITDHMVKLKEDWKIKSYDNIYVTVSNGNMSFRIVAVVSENLIRRLNALDSLEVYAKAEKLWHAVEREEIDSGSEEYRTALNALIEHVETMGSLGNLNTREFIDAYRDAVLKQLETK